MCCLVLTRIIYLLGKGGIITCNSVNSGFGYFVCSMILRGDGSSEQIERSLHIKGGDFT